ncbi:MAG: DUF1538 family protein [Nitrospirales bacterium]
MPSVYLQTLIGGFYDLLPIILAIEFFQLVVLQQPIHNLVEISIGSFFVLIGLTLFVQGLEMGLFPLGESLAFAFAKKGSLTWLRIFVFALRFATIMAKPALIAVDRKQLKLLLMAMSLRVPNRPETIMRLDCV